MLATTTLTNHFLIAMPSMRDPSFKRGVAFLCQHGEEGAMGLLVNRLSEYRLGDVLAQMNLSSTSAEVSDSPVERYRGGLPRLPPGEHTIAVRAYDRFQNVGSAKTTFEEPASK